MKARTAEATAGSKGTMASTTPPVAGKRGPYRAEKKLAERNLVEAAARTGRMNSFGAAIRLAGLEGMLNGKGPFTVFAPTDEAFARMPKTDLDALLEDKPRLTRVLTYHLVPEIVAAPRPNSPRRATTVNGATLEITAKDHGFRVNEATVVKTEITAFNGVIHAIDMVLMPR